MPGPVLVPVPHKFFPFFRVHSLPFFTHRIPAMGMHARSVPPETKEEACEDKQAGSLPEGDQRQVEKQRHKGIPQYHREVPKASQSGNDQGDKQESSSSKATCHNR